MTILHYMHFASYPWQEHEEFTGKQVVLVFVRPVIEELNRHKDTNKRGKVKARCRKVLGWIEENLSGTMGREVDVSSSLSAKIHFRAYSAADPIDADDKILCFSRELGSDTIVFTGDYSLGIAAKESGLSIVKPLAAHRITDDEDTTIEQLQRELAILQNRQPMLSLAEESSRLEYNTGKPLFDVQDYHHNRFMALTSGLHPSSFQSGTSLSSIFRHSLHTQSYFDQYDADEVKSYENQLKTVIDECLTIAMKLCQSPIANLNLVNSGSSPASNIEISLKVPNGFSFVCLKDLEFPKMPRRPRTRSEMMLPYSQLSLPISSRLPDKVRSMTVHGNQAAFQIPSLLQSKVFRIPSFAVVSNKHLEFENLRVELTILASEIPKPHKLFIPTTMTEAEAQDRPSVESILEKLRIHLESPDERKMRLAKDAAENNALWDS